jgi:hypothetical protein
MVGGWGEATLGRQPTKHRASTLPPKADILCGGPQVRQGPAAVLARSGEGRPFVALWGFYGCEIVRCGRVTIESHYHRAFSMAVESTPVLPKAYLPATDTAVRKSVSEKHFAIGDLSDKFGVTLRALRFYEGAGLLQPHRRDRSRLYGTDDVFPFFPSWLRALARPPWSPCSQL